MNGRVLISEEPLEVTPISWETRAIFRTVARPRKDSREASKYAAE